MGWGGDLEGALLLQRHQLCFSLASETGLTDNPGRAGSLRSNESSCCVNGKQQQEPWAQFTHTWHRARLQGVKPRREQALRLPLREGCVLMQPARLCDQPEGAGTWWRVTGFKGGTPVLRKNRMKNHSTPCHQLSASLSAAGFEGSGGPC